ncbi:PAS domain S-box protein, partial [bacterium]
VDYLLKKDLTCRVLERSIRYAIQRKASEASLDQARRLSQSIVDTLPDCIAVLDKAGKIVTVNAAWKEMDDPHPFPSSKLEVGTDFLEYCNSFGSACMAEIASGLEGMLENPFSEKPFFVEYAYDCAQGEGCWLELRATPVHDSTPPLIVVSIKDITERKRGEVRLKTSAANLQQAQRMASLGSWELEVSPSSKGPNGRRYWSDETFRILGYSPREVEPTYDNFIRVVHPEDVQSFEAEVEKATNDKRPCALDHRIVLSDGTERFVQERIDPILGDAGELVKLVGTIQDITPRKQAEEQLRFQQTLLEAQTEASLDGILVVSDEAKILSYNNRFVQLWDIPPEVVALKNDVPVLQAVTHRLLHPEQFLEKVQSLYQNRDEKSHDEILLKDGRVFDRYSTPIVGAGGYYYGRVWYFRDITQRKQSEAALEKSNLEMRTIWESMTDAFYTVDREWRFTQMNSQALEILQQDTNSVIGHNMWEVFPEAKELDFFPRLHEAMETQTPVVFEEHFSPLNIWTEVHAYPSPIGLSVYFRNVTERRLAEKELRASEARFQGIVSNVPGMVYQFVFRVDGTIEFAFVSDGSIDLVGLKPQEIRDDPQALLNIVHPDDRASYALSISDALQTMNPWTWEGRGKLPSGEIKWFQGVSHPRPLPDGGSLWDGLIVDITARKEAEEERDRFFTLSIDMLAIVSRDGWFKRFNPAFESTLGYSAAELMAMPLIDIVHPDDKERTQAQVDKLENDSTDFNITNRNICSDGTIKWLSWHVVIHEDLFYVVAHDISRIVEAENALRQTNEGLEQKVAARTSELARANDELRVENVERQMTLAALRQVADAYRLAKDESDAASKAKSEFLSRMSHELRTPLNAILGFGQILQQAGLPQEENEQVGHILNGGWHLLDLINEVLDISRVEAGNLELALESTSLGDVIMESCNLVGPLATQRKVSIITDTVTNQNFNVIADRQRLKQIFINLISNGIKYNRDYGQVSFSILRGSNGEIRVGVHDTGIGISESDQKKLFVPFERLNSANVDGTGLGLVLSKHLLTAMGGRLNIESEVGKGTTFWIELTETVIAVKSEDESVKAPPLTRPSNFAERSYTVLSIEDNISNQKLLQQLLSNRPEIIFKEAALGETGLQMAADQKPDLILLNLNLPDISGREILLKLRSQASTQEIPVIVVSADATQPQIRSILADGASAYLTKPYNVTELQAAIDSVLYYKNPSDVSKTVAAEPEAPRSLRVLVAEDNMINQQVVSHQLKKLGHQPFVCKDGYEVLDAWQNEHFDLILMDCQMPGMDGYEATAEIRSREVDDEHIPIIALTANALPEDREKSLASGMDAHLSKPIKQAQLVEAIEHWFQG